MFPRIRAICRDHPWSNLEIVVPIFVRNKLVAELDIESYFTAAFPRGEQDFVENCAAIVRDYLGKGIPVA
jgi:putative methionine-R-sulfoxide reductase with GAF domain